jgi:threonyl-tRNA synthetase
MIEHVAGAFPVWCAPEQLRILSVSDTHSDYCHTLAEEFTRYDIRVTVDDHSETIGKKIRKSSQEKIPYVLVIGDKEIEAGKDLSVRVRGQEDLVNIDKDSFVTQLATKITNRDLELDLGT